MPASSCGALGGAEGGLGAGAARRTPRGTWRARSGSSARRTRRGWASSRRPAPGPRRSRRRHAPTRRTRRAGMAITWAGCRGRWLRAGGRSRRRRRAVWGGVRRSRSRTVCAASRTPSGRPRTTTPPSTWRASRSSPTCPSRRPPHSFPWRGRRRRRRSRATPPTRLPMACCCPRPSARR